MGLEGCGNKIGPYDCCTIVTGDAKELAKAIPDESIDLIFTDPVYDRIEDYRWLAETAARILVDGGNCIAQFAHYYLPQVVEAMTVNGLDYNWILAERMRGGQASLFKYRLTVCWKPYIWYSRGKRIGGWVFDWIEGGGIAKDNHRWGDSPEMFTQLIARLVKDGLVWDSFCGGGTVAAACEMLGRHYLAFEIDPEVAERARERVRNTQPPLFVMEPEQTVMEWA